MGLFNKKELARIAALEQQLFYEQNKNQQLGIYSYEDSLQRIEQAQQEAQRKLSETAQRTNAIETEKNKKAYALSEIEVKIYDIEQKVEKTQKSLDGQEKKLRRVKELYKALLEGYNNELDVKDTLDDAELLSPTVMIDLHCLTYQDLRKEYRENEKNIKDLLSKYEKRYTTKGNKAIYQLMVLALQAELQNILSVMKYDKLESATKQVESLCIKFSNIAMDGNQQIAPTIMRFIGEMKFLFINAVKIEYEYYVKKEREREEQAAIREQMRQEAEERKELERQKQQIEREESKFLTEIENVKDQITVAVDDEIKKNLEAKIKELEEQLNKVAERKEDIMDRQNGKAGNVYVISNLGAFGDNIFKIGMTRRLEPLDRVKELGDASVPFGFDVHAMIFSEDAVSLENKLHEVLNDCRLNKVNLRKEFFKLSLDEIEKTVLSEDPAAAFNRTMYAEQYRQSLSMAEI